MNRRRALTILGGLAAGSRLLSAQIVAPSGTLMPGTPEQARTRPILAGYSGNLAKVEYPELGDIAAQIGYEAIDLTVMTGGHVNPRLTNVDLIRAFESMRASQLDIPLITTNITTVQDQTAYAVMVMTARSMIPMCRLGYFPLGNVPRPARVEQVRSALQQIVFLARRSEILPLFPNHSGDYIGATSAEVLQVLREFPPQLAGVMYDTAYGTAGDGDQWEAGLRSLLPRIKAISVQDFRQNKDDGSFELCPLGEGLVEWDRLLGILAEAKFLGPFTIHTEYPTDDAPGAMKKDFEFIRAKVEKAWAPKQNPPKS